jgi:hypothetical protein
MFTRFVAANPSSLVCLLWGIGGGIVSARDTTPIAPLMGEDEDNMVGQLGSRAAGA